MENKKVFYYTLGCRVNQYETDALRQLFNESGFIDCDSPNQADIIVVNTCSVTGEADRKSRQQLRRMHKLNPMAIVCSVGCFSESVTGKIEADIVCGTKDKKLLVEKVVKYINSKDYEKRLCTKIIDGVNHVRPEVTQSDVYHDFGTVVSPEGTRAFVKIEDGCNNFCSYCIIPYTRGRIASRDETSILNEVEILARNGFKEIIISGIHLCSYGIDQGKDIMYLLELLQKINEIKGVERIRLGSLEPMSLTTPFINGLAQINKICPHFHLSLQSGSDTVLKRMNRKYTTEIYENKVALLREKFPDMSLTTDVICGFPGETTLEFDETYEFIRKLKFSKLHVFPYSMREGTPAAKMKQVPHEISKQRVKILNEYSAIGEENFAKKFIGKEVEVLCEKVDLEANNCVTAFSEGKGLANTVYYSGYTREYVKVLVGVNSDSNVNYEGKILKVIPHDAVDKFLIATQIHCDNSYTDFIL